MGHDHISAGTAGGELEAAAGRAAKKEQRGKRRKKKNVAEGCGRRGGGSIRPDRVSGGGVNRVQHAVTGAERRRCLLTQRQRGPVSWLPHPQMW